MNGPVSEAKARLTELARRAEAGEDVVLTRHGQAMVRLGLFKDGNAPTSGSASWTTCRRERGGQSLPGRMPLAARISSTTMAGCRGDRDRCLVAHGIVLDEPESVAGKAAIALETRVVISAGAR